MIDLFELEKINKSSASFNQEKLDWINQSYIKTSEINELVSELKWHLNQLSIDLNNGPDIKKVVEALRDRSKSLVDMAKNCVMFYHDFENFDSNLAIKFFNLESRLVLHDLLINFNTLEQWTAEHIHEVIQSICESRNVGFGKVGQPFRLAISGDGKAGSIDKCAQLVGKKRVLLRLKMAINWIDSAT
jgi:glutamyl-tRNA synthetase